MRTDSYIEDNYPEELIARSALIYKTSSIHLTRNDQDKSLSADVADGKIYQVTIENPLTAKQDCLCQCSQYLENGQVCRHIIATLLSYRDVINDDHESVTIVKPIQQKSIKRLNIAQILENVSKDELNSFILSYAREDKRLSTAIKVHFARVLESDQKADKYKSILNSILPPVTNKTKKFSISDIKSLCRVLDDFYGQMQDCLALGEYLEASFILEAALNKISYVLHFAHHQHEVLLELSKKFHESIFDFVREKISPALKQNLKKMLFELTQASYYELFHPKANAFNYLMQLAKTSEKAMYFDHITDCYKKSQSLIYKEHIFITIWLNLPVKQQIQWLEILRSDKLSLSTINKQLVVLEKIDKLKELCLLFLDKIGFDKDIANQYLEILAGESNLNLITNHVFNCIKLTKDYTWVTKLKKLISADEFKTVYVKIDDWIKSHPDTSLDFTIVHIRCGGNIEAIMDEIAKQNFSFEAISAYEDILYHHDVSTVAKLYIYHIDDYLENHIGLATASYLKELRQHVNKAGMRDIVLPVVRHLSIQYNDKPYLTESFGLM